MNKTRKKIIKKDTSFFTFLDAPMVHPHDRFFSWTILRFFPRFVTPNIVTTVRFIGTPFVFLLIQYNYFKAGIIAFLALAFTDALDGSLARTRNQITRFGMMFDPLADKLLVGPPGR